jgi:hypothetical protein
MVSMFTNYETGVKNKPYESHFHPVSQKEPKIITNIKGEILGVQVEQSNSLQL